MEPMKQRDSNSISVLQQEGHKSPPRSRTRTQAAAHNRSVGGSSPPPPTKKEAPAWQVLLFGIPPPGQAASPFGIKMLGAAKPPLRNSLLRS